MTDRRFDSAKHFFDELPYLAGIPAGRPSVLAPFDILAGVVRSGAALAELVRQCTQIADPIDLEPESLHRAPIQASDVRAA